MDLKKIFLIGVIGFVGYKLTRPKTTTGTGTGTGSDTATAGSRPGAREKIDVISSIR